MSNTIKVWHVEATRKAAEVLGIDTDTLTREQYAAFESLVWPLYETEHLEVRESMSQELRAKLSPS